MTQVESREEKMFEFGATAAARAGNCSPRYVCPICLGSFFEFDPKELTVEHVPAKALGGKPLLLTCRQCNNEAGHELQSHQAERERREAFWQNREGKPLNLEVQTPSGVVRGEVKSSGEPREFTVHAHRTAPDVLDQVDWRKVANSEFRLGRKFKWGRARIGDLRDAYLWVFAQYGYSCVAVPSYDWIRSAIRSGQAANDKWAIALGDDFTKLAQEECRGPVILVTEVPQCAIVVADGDHGCILPTPQCPDPYAELSDDRAQGRFVNKAIPVPKEMVLAWDYMSQDQSGGIPTYPAWKRWLNRLRVRLTRWYHSITAWKRTGQA